MTSLKSDSHIGRSVLRSYVSTSLFKIIIIATVVVLLVILPPDLGVPAKQYYTSVLIAGLLSGGIYVIIASGLTLIMGVMNIVNICHGDFVILAAYMSFWMSQYGFNPILSLAISFPLFFAIGIPIQRYLFSRGLKFGIEAPLIVAFGLSNILQYGMQAAWTSYPRTVITAYSSLSFSIGPALIPVLRAMILPVTVAVVVLLTLFLKRTYTGMAIRATAIDWQMAAHLGINVERINILAYSIGLALAAIAGTFISLVIGFAPTTGISLTLKAFAAIVLGGVGSIPGALVGGIILGYADSGGSFFLGPEYRDAVGYIVFFVVLMLRPSGLLQKLRTE